MEYWNADVEERKQLIARITELERDLQSCRHDYAEHVAMVARKERPAYDEQQRRITEIERENEILKTTHQEILKERSEIRAERDRLHEIVVWVAHTIPDCGQERDMIRRAKKCLDSLENKDV